MSEVTTPINCLCLIFHAFSLGLAQWIGTETRHMYTVEVGDWYECVNVNQNILNLMFVGEVTTPINCLCLIFHAFSLDLAQWIGTETRHMYTVEVGY